MKCLPPAASRYGRGEPISRFCSTLDRLAHSLTQITDVLRYVTSSQPTMQAPQPSEDPAVQEAFCHQTVFVDIRLKNTKLAAAEAGDPFPESITQATHEV